MHAEAGKGVLPLVVVMVGKYLRRFRQHCDSAGARVDATLSLRGGDSLYTMNAGFQLNGRTTQSRGAEKTMSHT